MDVVIFKLLKKRVNFQLGAVSHTVDNMVVKTIHSLVADGVRSTSEMRRHVTAFSKQTFPWVPTTATGSFPTTNVSGITCMLP